MKGVVSRDDSPRHGSADTARSSHLALLVPASRKAKSGGRHRRSRSSAPASRRPVRGAARSSPRRPRYTRAPRDAVHSSETSQAIRRPPGGSSRATRRAVAGEHAHLEAALRAQRVRHEHRHEEPCSTEICMRARRLGGHAELREQRILALHREVVEVVGKALVDGVRAGGHGAVIEVEGRQCEGLASVFANPLRGF